MSLGLVFSAPLDGVCYDIGTLECANLTVESACTNITGCSWDGSCTGTATGDCSNLTDYDDCDSSNNNVCGVNSNPLVMWMFPENGTSFSTSTINLTCRINADDDNMNDEHDNLTFFVWNASDVTSHMYALSGTSQVDQNYSFTGINGIYEANCLACDNTSLCKWGSINNNITFILADCNLNTDVDACDEMGCEWEFSMDTFSYYCTDEMNPNDYCAQFSNYSMPPDGDMEGCLMMPYLFGCYWDSVEKDCMPVDGDCSLRNEGDCENYVGCSWNGTGCLFENNVGENFMVDNEGCFPLNATTCETNENCTWEDFPEPMCMVDCFQYDDTDNSTCESAFSGNVCMWDEGLQYCDPAFFDKGFDGFSPCFDFDGNQTGCDTMSECVWFSDPYCPEGQECEAVDGGNDGWCDPNNFDWGMEYDCWSYDGNQTGCLNSVESLGWACQWSDDPWYMGPIGAGDDGWCNPSMFGSGGGMTIGGCWDYWDQSSCDGSADAGLLCSWKTSSETGWCEEKGCWNYWDQSSCDGANSSEGCEWNLEYSYCYQESCWDLGNESTCGSSGLDCEWKNYTYGDGGQCEENGCWNRDWTNETYCEVKTGCTWDENWCNMDGCWNYEQDQNDCETTSGLDCTWRTDVMGWCEEQRCWDFDGNQTGCENDSVEGGLSCQWDVSSNLCFENFKSCSENTNMFDCFGTGWCFWDGDSETGNCSNPNFDPIDFFNPGCWIFDMPSGAEPCGNITTCNWTGTNCDDLTAEDNNGIQCVDINNSQLCNSIPMLSTCCSWNGTGCEDAPQTIACWDNMQEPPEGGMFCDDYNAKTSQTICEQIASSPWYMPCVWDNVSSKCGFAFDNFFGGDATDFKFDDLNSGNCVEAGGVWKSEQWTDANGNVQWDNWCEMNFGFGTDSCANSCWACEFQDNGTDWSSNLTARDACDNSPSGCNFYEDSNAFNGRGWCDMDWQKQGNCEDNCWDCWDQGQCGNSNAGCKWFVDPWNDNTGWCDDKNIKTCEDDCFMCWDQNNCGQSSASCTWNTDSWFCEPAGSGDGGSFEVCFDGIDNDADTFVDCADPECMFDPFCGGSAVFGSNCPSIPNNDSCVAEGCVWITDNWNNSWCDMPGAQCWLYDDNETVCNEADNGCNYKTMDDIGKVDMFCEINWSYMDETACWNHNDNVTCDGADGCAWMEDKWCIENPSDPWCLGSTGWCDSELWSCHNYDSSQETCEEHPECGWVTDWFNPEMGFCDPICFSRDNSTCGNDVNISGVMESGVCESFDAAGMGWCEPENMFKGCWDHDDNETACNENNASCAWIIDPYVFGGGFCGDKFMQNMVGNMDPSPPLMLASEGCSNTNPASDICGLGIKDDFEAFAIGTNVFSMGSTILCNSTFSFDSMFAGEIAAKFYWYVDSNGDDSNGCNATDDNSLGGFDLKFKYETIEQNGELVETKVAYKCLDGQWSPSQIKITPWPEKSCYMVNGGVISISKDDLAKLSVLGLYDTAADMRIYATTATSAGSDSNVTDSIGPVWYSHGSADFKFEDCNGFTDKDGDGLLPSEDPDCIDFFKYGFIDIESGLKCGDNIDNDGNGFTDCEDYGCMYDLAYCTAADSVDDFAAPKITWLETDPFMYGAFVGVDTNEPTNATLLFYKNDSYCGNISNGIVVSDPKLNNNFALDDFDMWHDFPVDQIYFDEQSYDFTFETNETYYFKLKLCDKNNNCAQSACTSFTTATNESEYFVGFKLPNPKSDVTTPLGALTVDLGGAGSINNNNGLKINDSVGRDINITFTNPNATNPWSITFIGADLLKAQSMNITDAFIVDSTFVGMDTDRWSELAQKLGVDLIKIVLPFGVPSGSTGSLKHCPDNATSLTDSRCMVINLDEVDCTFTTASTTCYIPTAIGFSVFGVVSTTDDDDDDDSSSSSSSSGGGGVASAVELSEIPIIKSYAAGGKYEFKFGGVDHSMTVDSIIGDAVTITIASEPTIFSLKVGESAKKDLDSDGDYDIKVEVLNITTIVELSISKIEELIEEVDVPVADEKAGEGDSLITGDVTGSVEGIQKSSIIFWIIGGFVVVILVIGIIIGKKKKK